MNFVDMVLFHARANPERPAIAFSERAVNYREVGQGIRSAERRLAGAGVKPGDLVAIEIDNPIVHLILICALYRLGVASISLALGTQDPIDQLGITLMLKARPGGIAFSGRTEKVDEAWFTGPPLTNDGGRGFADPNDTCRVMLSSGTTGRPKSLLFSCAAIEARVVAGSLRDATPRWERMLCCPGLSTTFGFGCASNALANGRMVCFTSAAANMALLMIGHHALDFMVASPHQLQLMIEAQTTRPMPCASLRAVLVGGGLLTNTFLEQVRVYLCNTVISYYGATESGGVSYAPVDRLRRIDGAVGFVAPWAEVDILDVNGAPCPRGQEGTLRVRSPSLMARCDTHTPEADINIRDGWFYPGDLARMTEDGILVITGRSAALINAGGTKLAPELIEEVLRAHRDIADAGAAGVIGSNGVEEIWAAIVPRREIAAETIVDHCRERGPDMVPRQVRFVAAIPRNEMGKVAREALKQLLTR